jgi:hypothetical protein
MQSRHGEWRTFKFGLAFGAALGIARPLDQAFKRIAVADAFLVRGV